jgi:hypothetical protein
MERGTKRGKEEEKEEDDYTAYKRRKQEEFWKKATNDKGQKILDTLPDLVLLHILLHSNANEITKISALSKNIHRVYETNKQRLWSVITLADMGFLMPKELVDVVDMESVEIRNTGNACIEIMNETKLAKAMYFAICSDILCSKPSTFNDIFDGSFETKLMAAQEDIGDCFDILVRVKVFSIIRLLETYGRYPNDISYFELYKDRVFAEWLDNSIQNTIDEEAKKDFILVRDFFNRTNIFMDLHRNFSMNILFQVNKTSSLNKLGVKGIYSHVIDTQEYPMDKLDSSDGRLEKIPTSVFTRASIDDNEVSPLWFTSNALHSTLRYGFKKERKLLRRHSDLSDKNSIYIYPHNKLDSGLPYSYILNIVLKFEANPIIEMSQKEELLTDTFSNFLMDFYFIPHVQYETYYNQAINMLNKTVAAFNDHDNEFDKELTHNFFEGSGVRSFYNAEMQNRVKLQPDFLKQTDSEVVVIKPIEKSIKKILNTWVNDKEPLQIPCCIYLQSDIDLKNPIGDVMVTVGYFRIENTLSIKVGSIALTETYVFTRKLGMKLFNELSKIYKRDELMNNKSIRVDMNTVMKIGPKTSSDKITIEKVTLDTNEYYVLYDNKNEKLYCSHIHENANALKHHIENDMELNSLCPKC